MNHNKLLLIIDEQRGFMPASEGERLQLDGFGELGVPEGEQTVAPINQLLAAATMHGYLIATTQDNRPEHTAHFAEEGTAPNFTTTWPRHCVTGTPGAALHPDLQLPANTHRFIKGTEVLLRGEDDLSYSGYYASEVHSGLTLPEWLTRHNVASVILGGLALDYCLGKTAIDLRNKAGLDVTVTLDATRPVADETGAAMLKHFSQLGIHTANSETIIATMGVTA